MWGNIHFLAKDLDGSDKLSVKKLCVSADGRKLFSVNDQTLNIWDLEQNEIIKSVKCGNSTLYSLSYSDEQNKIALGNRNGEVIIVHPNNELEVIKLEGSGFISSVIVANSGRYLYAGTEEGKIYKVDLMNGDLISEHHTHNNIVTALVYRKDGDQLISSGADGLVKSSKGNDLSNNEIIQKSTGWIRDLCLSNDESILITGNDAGKIYRYKINVNGQFKLVERTGQYANWVTCVDMAGNDLIAEASFSGRIHINFMFGSYHQKTKHRINDLCLIPINENYTRIAIATDASGVIFINSKEMKLKMRK